jgi:hypothetical protein
MLEETASLARKAMAWIAAAGLLGCLPAPAAAQPPTSQLALAGASADQIAGEVTSPSPRCLSGRVIRVDASGLPVTTVTSDAEGAFQIAVPELPAGAAGLTLTALRPPPGGQRACKPDATGLSLDQGALTGGVNSVTFGGRLSSNEPACVPERTIEVYEVTSDPSFVGFNFTDAAGDWVLAAAAGTYEARAVPAILGGPEAFTYCRALVSAPWFFEEPT